MISRKIDYKQLGKLHYKANIIVEQIKPLEGKVDEYVSQKMNNMMASVRNNPVKAKNTMSLKTVSTPKSLLNKGPGSIFIVDESNTEPQLTNRSSFYPKTFSLRNNFESQETESIVIKNHSSSRQANQTGEIVLDSAKFGYRPKITLETQNSDNSNFNRLTTMDTDRALTSINKKMSCYKVTTTMTKAYKSNRLMDRIFSKGNTNDNSVEEVPVSDNVTKSPVEGSNLYNSKLL